MGALGGICRGELEEEWARGSGDEVEGTQGETARIEGHSRPGRKATIRRNFLKYIKVILMKSLSIAGCGVPTDLLLSPNEPFCTRTELHTINYMLAKGVLWKSPNTSGCYQDNRLYFAD